MQKKNRRKNPTKLPSFLFNNIYFKIDDRVVDNVHARKKQNETIILYYDENNKKKKKFH